MEPTKEEVTVKRELDLRAAQKLLSDERERRLKGFMDGYRQLVETWGIDLRVTGMEWNPATGGLFPIVNPVDVKGAKL